MPSNQLGLGSNNAALISFSGSHEDSNEDDSIQDVSVITPVPRRTTTPQRKKAAFYGGMLDKFDQRLYQSHQLDCHKLATTRFERRSNDPPDSKAQMKDAISRRLCAKMINCFYTYSTMIIPPTDDCDWPNYQAALVIVDGYKPNPCGGGRNKNCCESRKQPLIKFMSGKKAIGEDILRKMNEGLLNVQSQIFFDKYEIVISYDKHDANKISFAANVNKLVSKTKSRNCHKDKTCKTETTYETVLKDYNPCPPPRGQYLPPYEFLYTCTNSKDLRQKISQWKQFTESRQEKYLAAYKNMTDERIKAIISENTYLKNDQYEEKVIQENQTLRRTRGSPPSAPKDVRDLVTTSTRKKLFNYLFKFIHATTPQDINSKGEDTASWPVLSACVIIIDQYNPKRCGNGKQKNDVNCRKAKETINIISGSDRDTQTIIEALQCFVSVDERKSRKYAFYPIHDKESAIKADNHGLPQDCRRT